VGGPPISSHEVIFEAPMSPYYLREHRPYIRVVCRRYPGRDPQVKRSDDHVDFTLCLYIPVFARLSGGKVSRDGPGLATREAVRGAVWLGTTNISVPEMFRLQEQPEL
jgi:hypothetical protein